MYSQTMAARFDCKKLLRFALATLCLLALALLMPVAARAEETDKSKETGEWKAKNENDTTLYATFERNGTATETDLKQGKVNLEVYVMKPGKAAYGDSSQEGTDYDKYTTSEFYYQYNANVDDELVFDGTNHTFTELDKNNKEGKGKGGYGSLDLKVTAGEGYTIYRVDYSVCYSSGGPTKTGWKTQDFKEKENVDGPTRYCYLDNIQDGTIAKVYLMPTYTVQYKVVDKDGNDADLTTYSVVPGDSLDDVTVLPYKKNFENVGKCDVLHNTGSYTKGDGTIAPYHRWCSAENEDSAVNTVKSALNNYKDNTSVTLPKLTAADGYNVSAWTHNDKEYSGTLDLSTLSAEDFAALANDKENPLTITLTAVVTKVPTSTDDSGNGGTTGGDSGDSGSTGGNTGSGDSGNNGGQESTPTPTPTSTPSVTTVTAVAPTATPTATPAPTAEPTATPAPAAVSAHIPQTSDDMPYTLLVVTALASLCAAGALFMKRRSK